jgi:hypothetical protein
VKRPDRLLGVALGLLLAGTVIYLAFFAGR